MSGRCEHVWTLFAQGNWASNRPYWRLLICVKCYAKHEVPL